MGTNTPPKGLNDVPADLRPPIQPVFQLYHLMVFLGVSLTFVTLFAGVKAIRGTLWNSRWLLQVLVLFVAVPHICNQAGWVAAELGRQPWIVYGMMKTSDGLSKTVPASLIVTSIALFTAVYAVLAFLFFYLLNKRIQIGPEDPNWPEPTETMPDREVHKPLLAGGA